VEACPNARNRRRLSGNRGRHRTGSHVTSASADNQAVQVSTRASVKLTHVDQGYTSLWAAEAARAHSIALQGLTLPKAKRCFVLLVKDGQRHANALATFTCLVLKQAVQLAAPP
jgi:hypothetical protein